MALETETLEEWEAKIRKNQQQEKRSLSFLTAIGLYRLAFDEELPTQKQMKGMADSPDRKERFRALLAKGIKKLVSELSIEDKRLLWYCLREVISAPYDEEKEKELRKGRHP